jgi:hypothetical protein
LAENDSQDTVSFIYNWDPPPITWTHKTIKPNGKCAKWPFAATTTTTITFFFSKIAVLPLSQGYTGTTSLARASFLIRVG